MSSLARLFVSNKFPKEDCSPEVEPAAALPRVPMAQVVRQENRPQSATPLQLTTHDFVERFLEWNVKHGSLDWIRWRAATHLAFEFASFQNVAPISNMALSKQLAKRGVQRQQRYLKNDEPDYQKQRDCGHKRPRHQYVRLPRPSHVEQRCSAKRTGL
ncbi:MAG: hypothetical protein RIC14_08700 [Filomicrobium sp.]